MATRAPDYALEGESGDRERYLVLAHQAGDPFAFTEIVKDHYTALYAHAIRRMGDQRAAEDVVQDALLRAYRGLDKFSGEFKLSAWLHRIVDNIEQERVVADFQILKVPVAVRLLKIVLVAPEKFSCHWRGIGGK